MAVSLSFSFLVLDVELFLRLASISVGLASVPSAFLFAIGHESPRSLPLLATPTPHVKVVLYPEHSFPMSIHCVQYGRFRSHFTARFLQVKQSSEAPPPAVRRLLFLGGGAVAVVVVGCSIGCSVGARTVDVISKQHATLQAFRSQSNCHDLEGNQAVLIYKTTSGGRLAGQMS